MDMRTVDFQGSDSVNVILGMSHFIKTVDDLSEIIVTTVPGVKYAVVFCEASGPALIRHNANDESLLEQGINLMSEVGAGHSFVILLKDAYPINILSKVKQCDEVVRIFCATANSFTVIAGDVGAGTAILGVADGVSPKGVENADDRKVRRDFLRKIGYKF